MRKKYDRKLITGCSRTQFEVNS